MLELNQSTVVSSVRKPSFARVSDSLVLIVSFATSPGQHPRLRYSRALALLASAITSLGSIIVLIFTAQMSSGVPTTALANIFSVLLSLGIVGIVYDVFLRGSVLNETLEIVGIEESVANVGLHNIQQGSPPDWKLLCSGAQNIAILLTNPLAWVESEWIHVLQTANIRALDVAS